MIHPIPSRTFYDKDSANTVLAILKSEDLMPQRNARYPLSSSAATVVVREAGAQFDAFGTRANASLLANERLPRSRSDTVVEDWNDLFDAVTVRLRLIIAERHATTVESRSDEADRIRINVLECVEALEQLHAALKDELAQCAQR